MRKCPNGAKDFSPTYSATECGVTEWKEYIVLSELSCRCHPVTPHSASLHVGLKSCILSGYSQLLTPVNTASVVDFNHFYC
ncbi:hypothetical protein Barb7_02146 [Bacteroidales bacterium Barb7]|nr:hypothetical protein Barb7_02146 [Bacteroidales bacterium Barb7]